MMKMNGFFPGVATGVLVGTAITLMGGAISNKKGVRVTKKKGAGKVFHTMGNIVEDIADNIMDR